MLHKQVHRKSNWKSASKSLLPYTPIFRKPGKWLNSRGDIYNKAHHITDFHICKFPDEQLLKWIDTEYSLFRCFEEKVYAPIYSVPFSNCQELVKFSNIILNRRKSRAGKSLSITLQRYSRRHNWNTKNKP